MGYEGEHEVDLHKTAADSKNDARTSAAASTQVAQSCSLAVLETDLRSRRTKTPRGLVYNAYTKIIEILANTRDPLLEGRSLTQLPRALMELERAKRRQAISEDVRDR